MNLAKRGKKVVSPVLGRYFPEFEIEKGKGCYVFGTDGEKYLDFSSGIASCSTGHCHPKVVEAVKKQAEKLLHICIGVANYAPYIKLAEELNKIFPIKNAQFFFCQSGSEAIEAAIKLAKYSAQKPGIAAIMGDFHGRTLGALSATTSKMKYREGYEPLLPETYIVKPVLAEIEELFKNKEIAGILFEPIQGEGGYTLLPNGFLQGLRLICDKYKVLLIADEVQTGMGRTGKWFACDHFGVIPDIICMAKGIASGLPLGAIGASAELMAKWPPGAHGSTFGGNPICCAAGIATIDVIKAQKLLANSAKLGKYLKDKLEKLKSKYSAIKDVRGLGLMIGVDFGDTTIVSKIMNHCLKNKLVIISTGGHGTVLRFIPPLTVTKKEIDAGLAIFEQALKNGCI